MRRGNRSTALTWCVISWLVCVGAILAVMIPTIDHILAAGADNRAELAVQRLTESTTATITNSMPRAAHRPHDTITLRWVDYAGAAHSQEFVVDDAAQYPVNENIPIDYNPTYPDVAFPMSGFTDIHWPTEMSAQTSTEYDHVALYMLALLVLPVPWLFRFFRWWRASRGERRSYQVEFMLGNAILASGTTGVWARIADEDRTRYQRISWEPWLAELPQTSTVLIGRRAGWGRIVLLEVPGHGLLWPASRARAHQPWFERLVPGLPGYSRYGRWSFLAACALGPGLVAGWKFGVEGGIAVATLAPLLGLFLGTMPPLLGRRSPTTASDS
jgi:hypothetical protein